RRALLRHPPRSARTVGDVGHPVLQGGRRSLREERRRQPAEIDVAVGGNHLVAHLNPPRAGERTRWNTTALGRARKGSSARSTARVRRPIIRAMTTRGIEAVLTHLASLPRAESLSFAELRQQYDRAERVFPTPPDVAVERVTVPVAPGEWLRPP